MRVMKVMKRRAPEHGSTMIEAMIVVACLGIVATAVGRASGARGAALGVAQQRIHATRALESELERLRATTRLPRSAVFRNPEVERLFRAVAFRAVGPARDGLVRLELRIEWHDALRRRQRLALVTLLPVAPTTTQPTPAKPTMGRPATAPPTGAPETPR